MSDLTEKLTVVIKTFERPELVKRAVSSLRLVHDSMKVVVADDSRKPTSFEGDTHTVSLHLPFDSGISFGRNRAIEMVDTPYYLLIDDDHCFERDCNLEDLVEILESTDFDMVGMRMLNYRAEKGYCRGELHFAGIMEREEDEMVHYIDKNRGFHQGYPIYDILLNCYAAKKIRTKMVSYDENIKIGKEHGDYFLEAKKAGLLATLSQNSFIHHRPAYGSEYTRYRLRVEDYTEYYFKKHGLKSEQTIGKNYLLANKMKYYPQRIEYFFKRAFKRKWK